MEAKREQVFVGLFVVIAATLLIITVFTISGAFAGPARHYYARFHNAAGLERGAVVRYEGGPKIGRVESVKIDPKDPSFMDMEFSVKENIPIKTDSHVAILSFSPLGDNHLEIVPGSAAAPLAPDGSLLPSDPYVDFNALTQEVKDIAPDARQLLKTLSDRAAELKVTINRINDLLNDQNRANLAGTLAETKGMIAENRAPVRSTVQNLSSASQKLEPLLQDLRKTSDQANQALNHIDGLIGENRPDVRQAVAELRKSLTNMTDLTGHLDQTLDVNSDNIDELLVNLRHTTQNLKEFTNTIKTRPYTLIRSSNPQEHKPGEPQ
jgi:virulence factor Mce-like protein